MQARIVSCKSVMRIAIFVSKQKRMEFQKGRPFVPLGPVAKPANSRGRNHGAIRFRRFQRTWCNSDPLKFSRQNESVKLHIMRNDTICRSKIHDQG